MDTKYREFVANFFKEHSNLDVAEINEMLVSEKSESYLLRAITHKSVDKIFNYEEIEFLGDRRLKSAMNSYLFINFPDIAEKQKVFSEMQIYLDSEIFLVKLSELIAINQFIKTKGNQDLVKIQEDVFEGFIGALYLVVYDFGGASFAAGTLEDIIHSIMKKADVTLKNRREYQIFKNKLVSVLNQNGIKSRVNYNVVDKTNNSTFIKAVVNNIELGVGSGKNIAEGENNAAEDALENLTKYQLQLLKNVQY